MSEDEAIEYVKEILKYPKLYAWTEKEEDFLRGIDKAKIETILDLYQKEKEKNKELSEELTERICKNVEAEVFEEMRLELKQEKEKNEELLKDNNVLNRLVYFNKNITFPYETELTRTNNYISKDKIRAKIKEVKRKREEEWETAGISMLGSAIDVLLELLEEEE